MHPVKQQLKDLLAQAKGTRWDVLASKTCFTICGALTIVAGLAPYTGFIPGRAGTIAAGIVGCAGALLPRATKAAGILKAAQDQKTPFLRVLPELVKTLVTAPQITADAKAKADAQQKAQQAQETMAIVNQALDDLEKRFKTGAFTPGTGLDNLSQDVPEALQKTEPTPATAGETLEGGTQ